LWVIKVATFSLITAILTYFNGKQIKPFKGKNKFGEIKE
jgi:hypothetical protein